MKRLFAFALTFMMVLSLAACTQGADPGGKTDPAPSGSDTTGPGTQQTDPGTSQQEPSNTSVPEVQVSDTAPKDEKDAADKTDTDSIASGWPENEFTELIPAPKAGTAVLGNVTESDCTVVMTWTMDELMEYVDVLKEAGFTESVEETDLKDIDIYSYIAWKDGVKVWAHLTNEVGGIQIVK